MSRKIFKKSQIYIFSSLKPPPQDNLQTSQRPALTTIYSMFYISKPQYMDLQDFETFNIKNTPQSARK